ncbi:hypothetical protein [Histidinibacterium lentulum]|uniref:hypothetical protein n=1 Tax=Histidinibacterium lentulum TaxID=2480588 RepID=UPI0011CE09BD|nr:hypothetical protein [Histidinibacterium lentulum]
MTDAVKCANVRLRERGKDKLLESGGFALSGFSWERGPFTRCANCLQPTMGILSAGGELLTKRCANCRATVQIPLPKLNKKAIYLDQFMFSMIYAIQNGGNLPKGHESFAKEVYALLRRCVVLQQVFLPHSDIHHDETTVFHSPIDLRGLYEFFGGDVSLMDSRDVELLQDIQFAKAYFDSAEPAVSFDLEQISDIERNEWLSDMFIDVRADYSQFADHIRAVRGEVHGAMRQIADSWLEKKATFANVLESEFSAIGPEKKRAFAKWFQDVLNPESKDPMLLLEASNRPIYREYRELCRLLEERGVDEGQHPIKIVEFWHSDQQREIPHQKISAYLFAAVARRVAMGEKRIVDRGLVNDVRTISVYAPYMDALFIDKRCAVLLKEEPLATALEYKARIFSLSDPDEFLGYLREIEGNTPDEVREYAEMIYGVE